MELGCGRGFSVKLWGCRAGGTIEPAVLEVVVMGIGAPWCSSVRRASLTGSLSWTREERRRIGPLLYGPL